MASNTAKFLLLTMALTAMCAAGSDVSESASGDVARSASSEARRSPVTVLHWARLFSEAPASPAARTRPRPRRRPTPGEAELEGLVEKSHLFTADPEAASAGKLYRQLSLYPSEPSAPSDDSDVIDEEGVVDVESAPAGPSDGLADEEYLLDDGDFGRRLQPETEATSLPAYPPYSHGPLAVPTEPYRSPEYGPASSGGVARQRAPAAPVRRPIVRPVPAKRPVRPVQTVQLKTEEAETPFPTRELESGAGREKRLRLQANVGGRTDGASPARRPGQYADRDRGRSPARRPYLDKAPVGQNALGRAKPVKTTRPPQKIKLAAAPVYAPKQVYYTPNSYYKERNNEIGEGPPQSLPEYQPSRFTSGPSSARSGYPGGRALEAVGNRYARPPAVYHNYANHRQPKESDGFERVRLPPHRYFSDPADVSYGVRTGGGGAFEWFSDHPVGSYH